MPKVLRVMVVADDPLARAGLAALLAQRPDIEVVGQAAGHPELATDAQVYRPDALVWDTGWEPAVVLERLADLRSELPPVVVLVAAGAQAAEARAAGAHGVLLREVTAPGLAAALRAVAEGLWVWTAEMAERLEPSAQGQPGQPAEPLTPRELEVLTLVASGLPNKAIAQRLGISEHTVKFHINAILGKLDASSRTDAVVRATRLGLVHI